MVATHLFNINLDQKDLPCLQTAIDVADVSQYFHPNVNSKAAAKGDLNYDPLFKVRPLLEQVRNHY